MKTFIFYTLDGFTQDINNKDIENMQILGFIQDIDKISACKNFKKIFNQNNEYCFNKIIVQEVVGKPTYLLL